MMIYILMAIGIVTIGLLTYIVRANKQAAAEREHEQSEEDEAAKHSASVSCCGAHEVCEAETLLAMSDKIIYYDDEELDRYRGRGDGDYSDAEVDEWREILLTLQTHEVAGWLRSLSLRMVTPPAAIRDEALMIVSEFREERREAAHR